MYFLLNTLPNCSKNTDLFEHTPINIMWHVTTHVRCFYTIQWAQTSMCIFEIENQVLTFNKLYIPTFPSKYKVGTLWTVGVISVVQIVVRHASSMALEIVLYCRSAQKGTTDGFMFSSGWFLWLFFHIINSLLIFFFSCETNVNQPTDTFRCFCGSCNHIASTLSLFLM